MLPKVEVSNTHSPGGPRTDEVPSSNSEVRISMFGVRTSNFELRTSNSERSFLEAPRQKERDGGGQGVGRRGSGTAVGGGDSGRAPGPSRGSPQLRRPPGPVCAGPPAGRLGWRLAADLELVRTRGIRLFN